MQLLPFFNLKRSSNILLAGDNSFINDLITNELIDLQKNKNQELEVVKFDLNEQTVNDLIYEASASSLFSTEKLIVIKNPLFLTSKFSSKDKKLMDALVNVFSLEDPLTNFIINISGLKIDERKKLSKVIKKNFAQLETNIRSQQLTTFTKSILATDQFTIDNDAVNELLSRSDFIPDKVVANLMKLEVVGYQEKKITNQLVKENIEQSVADNVFDILNALLSKDYTRAIQQLREQLSMGTDPVGLVSILTSQIRFMTQVKFLEEQGYTEDNIVKELSAHPYRVKITMRVKQSFKQLFKLENKMINLEIEYKTGMTTDPRAIETLVLNA